MQTYISKGALVNWFDPKSKSKKTLPKAKQLISAVVDFYHLPTEEADPSTNFWIQPKFSLVWQKSLELESEWQGKALSWPG